MTPAARIGTVLALAALLAAAGCERGAQERRAEGAAAPVQSTVERGPVSLTVRAEPGRITAGERLRLTIETVADDGVELSMPQLEETLGDFTVRERHTPPNVPHRSAWRTAHAYELDTFATGELEVPALTVAFVDRRPQVRGSGGSQDSGEPVEGELSSDPMTVTVRSVLGAEASMGDFHDIKPTVEVPVAAGLWKWWVAVLAVAAVLGLGAAAVALRKRGEPPAPVIHPHEWALGQLDELAREQLIEQGLFHEFYFRLSDIVRQYIERRFGLMAPERTTEEFLEEMRRSDVLGDRYQDLLAEFLRAADLVKFARQVPSEAEGGAALASARGFVQETRPAAAEQPQPQPAEAAA